MEQMKSSVFAGDQAIGRGVCLGTFPFGFAMPEEDSFNLLDAYLAGGGNCLDSAHVYGTWTDGRCNSESEKTIGKWLRARQNRHRVILGTKGASLDPYTWQYQSGRSQIIGQLDNSLKNCQTDYLDIYWLHRDDPQQPVAHYIDLLNEQVKAGKIRCFGCSNWTAGRIAESDAYARSSGQMGFFASQPWWSLARPNWDQVSDKTMVWLDAEGEAYHRQTQKAVIPYSSQAKHFFTKLDRLGLANLDEGMRLLYVNEYNIKIYEKMRAFAAQTGYTLGDIALAWLIHQDFPVVPLVGCSTKDQMSALFASLERAASDELRQFIRTTDWGG